MNCTQWMEEGIPHLAISGRIDSNTFELLERELNLFAGQPGDQLIVDMRHTDYISSSGLRVLLMFQKRMITGKRSVKLRSLQPMVREVFELTGFSQLFEITD